MKRIILLAALLTVLTIGLIGDNKPKQFEITFTITYNTMTLADAAKKEAAIRDLFKDACKVDVSVKEASNTLYFNGRNIFIDTIGTLPLWRGSNLLLQTVPNVQVK